jgi:hypothetical protein
LERHAALEVSSGMMDDCSMLPDQE